MNDNKIALNSVDAPSRGKATNYPEPFATQMDNRDKRPLSVLFGLTNITINLTRLKPDGSSALRHYHTRCDEFIYILEGNPSLKTDEGITKLSPGMCAGFKAGNQNAHCIFNDTDCDAVFLEAGDNASNDDVVYPDDDIQAVYEKDGWRFIHKDGTPY